MEKYDLIVIGGGAGGLTVAAGASGFGVKVALIEKEEQPGGDCLHTGCVPSKALIAAAKELYTARKAANAYGLTIAGEADYAVAYNRVQEAKAIIAHHDDADRFRAMGVDVYHGRGQFVDKHHIVINEKLKLYGKRIVIATGSRAAVPPIDGLSEVTYLTNESVFDMKNLPKRLVVIGAGPVGLELSQALARMGSEVTVLVRGSQLLKQEDEDIARYIESALQQELTIAFNTKVAKVEELSNGMKQVIVRQDGEERIIPCDAILIATGRQPNTDGLGLSLAGVQQDGEFIQVNRKLQTSVSHIYAVGDVIKPYLFTHVAGMEGKQVVGNAVFGLGRKISYEHVPWVIYTDPELFHLGMTEEQAREVNGEDVKVYKVGLDEVDRFITAHDTNGMVKVITDRKGRILGAHAVGSGAGEWMQEIVFAKRYGHKLGDISQVVHPYPIQGEALRKAADQYWQRKLSQGVIPRLLRGYVKWFR